MTLIYALYGYYCSSFSLPSFSIIFFVVFFLEQFFNVKCQNCCLLIMFLFRFNIFIVILVGFFSFPRVGLLRFLTILADLSLLIAYHFFFCLINVLLAFLEGPNPNVVFLYGVKKYYNLNSPTVQFELQIA